MSRLLVRQVLRRQLNRSSCRSAFSSPIHTKLSLGLDRLPWRATKFITATRNFSSKREDEADSKPTDCSSAAEGNTEENSKKTAIAQYDYDDYDDYEEPKTKSEWFQFYALSGFRLGLLAVGAYCIYVIACELFPGRMGPQTLFSETFDFLKNNDEV